MGVDRGYERLAPRLRCTIEAVCGATGAPQVDVVGHNLGGLVGRYLVETGDGGRVRRLVTLGAPHFTGRLPRRELAIFAAQDALIPLPHRVHGPHGRVLIIPDCGHLGPLYHPAVLRAVTAYLTAPAEVTASRQALKAA